jgi:hypothetical protein
MIRSLLKVGLFLVAGILVYNFFFGNEEEKAQSKEIFSKVRDLGREAWGLLRTEKTKFEDGKYDEAVDRIGGLYQKLNTRARQLKDTQALERLEELEAKRRDIESQLGETESEAMSPSEKADIRRQWNELMRETESLMNDMEQEQ